MSESNRVFLQIQFIKTNLREAITDILIQNSHAHIKQMIAIDTLNDNTGELDHIKKSIKHEYREFVKIKKLYDQARIINKEGIEVIRVNYNRGNPIIVPDDELQSKEDRYYFKESIKLHHNEIYMSPFDLNIENGEIEKPYKPMIRLATPLTDKNKNNYGIVVLNYLGRRLLDDISNIGENEYSQTMLLNSNGYWLKSTDKKDEWGFMFPDKKDLTFKNRYPEVWKNMQPLESGVYQNSKGLFSFQRVYPTHVHHEDIECFQDHKKESRLDHWIAISFIPNDILQNKFKKFKNITQLITIISIVLLSFFVIALAFYGENKKQLQTYQQKLIIELQEALDNIQVLSGLVPICAKCKSIRDDSGYWHILETYMEKHSDASFSHGLCPNCLKEMYGNEPWFDEMDYNENKPDKPT